MRIVKLFIEEPLSLEALTAEGDPDARRRSPPLGALEDLLRPPPYARAYLAGTDLAAGRVGATALGSPAAWRDPLLAALDPPSAAAVRGGAVEPLGAGAVREALGRPDGLSAMAWGELSPEAHSDLLAVAAAERRYAVPALRRLLDRGLILLFPEPAHDGHDWSLFSGTALREPLVAAFRAHPAKGVRRFVAPYQRMRSEHKFYFEQWALDAPPDGVEEVG